MKKTTETKFSMLYLGILIGIILVGIASCGG
jgi:hypothetical protein